MGVMVEAGIVKEGTPITVPSKEVCTFFTLTPVSYCVVLKYNNRIIIIIIIIYFWLDWSKSSCFRIRIPINSESNILGKQNHEIYQNKNLETTRKQWKTQYTVFAGQEW